MIAKKAYMFVFMLEIFFVFACFLKNADNDGTTIKIGETDMEATIESVFPQKNRIKELYGLANTILSPNMIDRIVKDEDNYLRPIQSFSYNTDDAAGRIAELRDECKKNGVEFAYFSFPSKSDGTDTGKLYGIESNSEATRDNFLNKLDEYGIDILNVRDQMEAEGLTRKDIFYKTDHHWNTKGGLFAARTIAQFLSDKGYNTEPYLLEDNMFSYDEYKNCWLGETGRKYSTTWVGSIDDFTVIKPKFDTSLEFIVPDNFEKSGDFSILLNESVYGTEFDIYTTSLHYTYMAGSGNNTIISNNNFKDGAKVLIINDSFSMVVAPFLSLAVGEVNIWDMRGNDASLYDYIKENDFDFVAVAYTDFFRDDMYAFY